MLLVFDRRLTVPLWATGCVAVALTVSPPATPFVVAILVFASIAFSMAELVPHRHPAPSVARARKLDDAGRGAAQDALALGRLDDDGGWQKRPLLVAVGVVLLGGQVLFSEQGTPPQDLSRYRAYALGSSYDSIVASSGVRASDTKTLQERPATIREVEWRAPYVGSGTTPVDPVRDIQFTFYNDALYQVVVSYDPGRTEGLTAGDIIESVSAVYGIPALASARANPPQQTLQDRILLARWETPDSLLTLVRDAHTQEFRLGTRVQVLEHARPERDPRGRPAGRDRGTAPRGGATQEGCGRRRRRARKDSRREQGRVSSVTDSRPSPCQPFHDMANSEATNTCPPRT